MIKFEVKGNGNLLRSLKVIYQPHTAMYYNTI